ncbi:hypothetical protein EC844_12269 [Acinetobacter calcoaceticus]|uniref:Lipoprotein n=1 Tax=Acinetobacter calcoaceticus TaxID=471 RepID=A0A4R1XLZ2_ACICA|nr:hypothetical protein EC844_12269 [Acinetobacter calcoaceticus]
MKNYLILSGLCSAFLLTGCGGSSDNDSDNAPTKPTEYVPSQYKTLSDNFNYVKKPLEEIQRNYLYDLSYWVDQNPLIISGYNYLHQAQNGQFKSLSYATSGAYDNAWRQDQTTALVFNITNNNWVETDGALTMSQGPIGTEGIPSLYVKSDTGVKYYTLTEKDLSGLSFDKGINQGFGNGIKLPEQIKTQYFSAGAKAYAWVKDITQPVYNITRTHLVFSSTDTTHPIYSCTSISSYCSSTVSSLENAIQNKSWYINIGKNGSIRLVDNQSAEAVIFDDETKQELKFKIDYKLIAAQQGQPKHILFTAPDAAASQVLKDYFSAGDSQLAWYEYKNKVVNGHYSLPVKGLQSTQYSYNKIAVNDILTQWTPKKNPVLE